MISIENWLILYLSKLNNLSNSREKYGILRSLLGEYILSSTSVFNLRNLRQTWMGKYCNCYIYSLTYFTRDGIRVVGKSSWNECDGGKFQFRKPEVGKFLSKLESFAAVGKFWLKLESLNLTWKDSIKLESYYWTWKDQ